MSRFEAWKSRHWVVQAVHVSDPPITSAAALVLLAKKYFGEDKSIYTNFRMMKVRRKWIKQLMLNPDEEGGLTCSICGKKGLLPQSSNKRKVATIDHIIDISEGGSWNDPNNFRIACSRCNGYKNDQKMRKVSL